MLSSFVFGLLFWMADSIYEYHMFAPNLRHMIFREPLTPLDSLLLNIPPQSVFTRVAFMAACLLGGALVSLHIRRRKQTERALAQSEESLATTLNSIGEAVIATDAAGTITRMNPVAEAMTGWAVHEAIGRQLDEILTIADADSGVVLDGVTARVLAEGGIVNLSPDTVLQSRDGTRRHIDESGAPIRTRSGETVGVVLVFRDVTQEHSYRAQMLQAQKLQAVGQLAGGVAHDFNNLLGGILGYADLLRMQLGDDPRLRGYAEAIVETSQRAADLTGQLLSFSRRDRVESVSCDIHDIIGKVVDLLEHTIDRRIEVKTALDATDDSVIGDPSQLHSAILNVAVNARDAMAEGGVLTFSTALVDIDATAGMPPDQSIEPGTYLQVRVTDTGAGIPPEILDRVFEPFFTTKQMGEGTGLGLSAAYGAARAHGGGINIRSRPGEGTDVRIYLPAAPAAPHAATQAAPQPIMGGGTVLLVDDEPIVRDMGSHMLQRLGYEVILAGDGAEAVDIYTRRRSEIDVVLLDLMMPKMNGRDALEVMHAIDPQVRVVLASGFSPDEDILQLLQDAPVRGFLRKPFSAVELSAHLAAALDRTPATGDGDAAE